MPKNKKKKTKMKHKTSGRCNRIKKKRKLPTKKMSHKTSGRNKYYNSGAGVKGGSSQAKKIAASINSFWQKRKSKAAKKKTGMFFHLLS